MKRCFLFFLSVFLLLSCTISAEVPQEPQAPSFDVQASSAVLMDATTGTVLYAKNADQALPPASVTKIMTLLLFLEEVEAGNISLNDELTVSDYAASMGGSQVYLEPGETMKAEELLKCVIIASANDAAVTLAEKTAGSEEAFVYRMNERAAELGMNNTHFENATGLDDSTTKHLTSAYDIALMSRELLRHPVIMQYSTIWMDTIRNGTFGLTNTNRLIRFYTGATGLKTGSTAKAGFCMSATAERNGLHLIAVIMGAKTRDIRNEEARRLLDYGFARYSLYQQDGGLAGTVHVKSGVQDTCRGVLHPYTVLLPKGRSKDIQMEILLPESISAPVQSGDRIGMVRYLLDGEILAENDITSDEDIEKIRYLQLFLKLMGTYCLK